MALHRIKDFDSDYRNHFENQDFKGLDFYSGDEKIGSVDDILVDDGGQFRYLIVNTGIWILGKKVLFPIGRARIDYAQKRVYADNLTKDQVEALPEFRDDMAVDFDHEEQVRGVYRSTLPNYAEGNTLGASADTPMLGLETVSDYDRETYTYDKDPDLYNLNDQHHPNLRLYEERLVAGKTRQKTGETVLSKQIETETAEASIAVEKERLVIERTPSTAEVVVAPGEANFQAGEVSRMEMYEEVPEFRKEAFVREEVKVSKVVDQETATAEEQLRREELDVSVEGQPSVNDAR